MLVETWLSPDLDNIFDLAGYTQYNVYRNSHGGGVKAYCYENCTVEIIKHLTVVNDICEVLCFYVSNSKFKYLICCIYRSPSGSIKMFNEYFFSEIIEKFPINAKVIVVGDIDIDLYNPLSNKSIQEFIENMWGYNYFPIITLPAKINENNNLTKYSLIDQIWSNFTSGRDHISGVIDNLITDHLPIFYAFCNELKYQTKYIEFRCVTDEKVSNFINCINRLNFELFEIDDPDLAFTTFYNKLFSEYNSCFPIKRKKINTNLMNEPWMTRDLRRCVKKKFKIYNLLKRGLISRTRFNVYKNTLAWLIEKMRKNYYHDKFKYFMGNQRETWKNINKILNRKKKQIINEIVNDDEEKLTGNRTVTYFNDYFCNVASNLIERLPQRENQQFLNTITRNPASCALYPTNEVEVFNVLKKLKDKGNNLYCIKPSILLAVASVIIPLLVYLFNSCIFRGIYPSALKTARVVPVFKDGNKNTVSNYRPISNLSSINKVFERLTYERLVSFISKYNIVNNSQFGFRKSCSTTLPIFTLLNDFLDSFRHKTFTIAIFLDLSKAFDIIDRKILLDKLELYGFRGVVNKFLASYLTNRNQYVTYDCFKSNIREIEYGVPQGSVLGPLFFNLFINDFSSIPIANKVFFADDSVFYVSDINLEECFVKLRNAINYISKWLNDNRLVVNLGKTKLMMITPNRIAQLPVITFNEQQLEWVHGIKYLGIHIDNKLNFNSHLNYVSGRLSRLSCQILCQGMRSWVFIIRWCIVFLFRV